MTVSSSDGEVHVAWPQRWWRRLIETSPRLTDPGLRDRSRVLAGLLAFMFVWALVILLAVRYLMMPAMGWRNPQLTVGLVAAGGTAIAFAANRRGHYGSAAGITVGALLGATIVACYLGLAGAAEPYYARDNVHLLTYLVLPLVLCAALLPAGWFVLVFAISVGAVLLVPVVYAHVSWDMVLYGPMLYLFALCSLLLMLGALLNASRGRSYHLLAEREEHYRSLFEESPDAVFLVASDGLIESVNRSGLALFGYAPEEIEGRHVRDVYANPDERAAVIRKAENQGSLKDEPVRLRTKDGSVIECLVTIWLRRDAMGRTIGYQTVVRNVTERLKAEEELALKGQLLDLANDVILLIDPGGEIVYANEATSAVTGYALPELAGMNIRHLNTVEGAEEVPSRISQMLRDGGLDFETVWVCQDGRHVEVEVRSRTIQSRGRTLFLSVGRDISKRRADEAELRLRGELLDAAQDSVFLHDLKGRIVYANESAWRARGYTRDEMLGMNVRDLDTPEDAARFNGRLSELLAKHAVTYEGDHVCKDGARLPVEVRSRQVESSGVIYVLSIVRDIRERRKAEEALRDSEARYRALFEQSIDAIFENAPDGSDARGNQAWLNLFGYSKEELPTLTARDLYVDEADRDRYVQQMREAGYVKDEVQLKRKDGSVILCQRVASVRRDTLGRVVAYQGVIRDITAQKKAEQQLRESEEKYRSLFAHSLDAVCLVSADGVLLDANKAYLDLYGYESSVIGSLRVRDHYADPSDREEFIRLLQREGVLLDHEVRLRKSDGTLMDCLRSSVAHKDDAGRIVAVQSVIRDITDRKRAEQNLRASEEKYRSLFEQSLDAIYVNTPDGASVEANQAWLDLFGYTRNELKDIATIDIYADSRDREWTVLKLERDGSLLDEVLYKRKDGTVFDCQRAVVARRDASGRVVAYQGVMRDVTEQKKAERTLRESEEKYRSLFEQSMDAVAVYGVDGTLLDANPAHLNLFELSREDIGQRGILSLYVDPEDRKQFLRIIERDGMVVDQEVRLRTKQGVEMDCVRSAVARRDANGRLVAAQTVTRDITAQKRAERELRESEQRYRVIADDTIDVIWRIDLDMSFTYVNPAINEMFGFTPEEWVGTSLAEHCSPDEFAMMRALAGGEIERLVQTGEEHRGVSFETTMLRRDGTEFPVEIRAKILSDAQGRPYAMHGITRDITGRRQAEQALRESEARFRALVEHTGLGMAITKSDGTILDCNDALPQMLGYSRDELLSLRVPDVYVSQSERERVLSEALRDGSVQDVEVEFRRRDASVMHVSLTSAIVPMGGETVVVSQFLDITERKAAELELLRSREELQRSAEQLHELTTYLEEAREKERTGIARELHDQLGQALTALRMDVDGMHRVVDAGQGVPVTSLDRMGALLDETVNDVRRISSDLRPGILDDAGLVAAIEWQLDRFQERSDVTCTLEAVADDSALSKARATALFRVFQELLTNVARHAGATQVWVAFDRDNGNCVLSVADDGRGITEEQAKNPASLGIIGIRERLRPHGGRIEFLRRRPKGTTARVTMPVA
jgi:PAS domain S-box-containing protein